MRPRTELAFAVVLSSIAVATIVLEAKAQQRTIYGADGKAIGRETTDTQGTRTLYGSDGKALTRQSGGTIYDTQSGHVIGKTTRDKR